MAAYLNKRTLMSFASCVGNLVNKKAIAVRFSQRQIKVNGLDIDTEYRAMRIMANYGYLICQKEGGYDYYTITPKGLALYDSLIIYLRPS